MPPSIHTYIEATAHLFIIKIQNKDYSILSLYLYQHLYCLIACFLNVDEYIQTNSCKVQRKKKKRNFSCLFCVCREVNEKKRRRKNNDKRNKYKTDGFVF